MVEDFVYIKNRKASKKNQKMNSLITSDITFRLKKNKRNYEH